MNASQNRLKTVGIIDVLARLRRSVVKLNFMFCHSLAALVTLGCDYCERFVKAIRPTPRLVELEEGYSVPMVRKSLKLGTKKELPLSAVLEPPLASRKSTTLRVVASVSTPLEFQVMEQVTSCQQGLRVIQPFPSLHEKYQLTIPNGVVEK